MSLAPEESKWADLPASGGWWDAEVVYQHRAVFQQFGTGDEGCSCKRESLTMCLKSHLGYVSSPASSFLCLLFLLPCEIWFLERQRLASSSELLTEHQVHLFTVSLPWALWCLGTGAHLDTISGYFASLNSAINEAVVMVTGEKKKKRNFPGHSKVLFVGKNLVPSQAEMTCSPAALLCP